MNAIIPETYGNIGPWQRYVAKERAARAGYLAVVERAHNEYLTGPWPDREAYEHVERSAWMTYYAAGREAWRYYTDELTPPPPPATPPSAASHPYPYHPDDYGQGGLWQVSPTFNPVKEGDH